MPPPVSLTLDETESLLTAWGDAVAAEYAALGYSAVSGIYLLPRGSLTAEEADALADGHKLRAESHDYVWLPDDLDRCEAAMQWLMVREAPAVRVLKGCYVFGWRRGRAHSRAVDQFRAVYAQVCDVRCQCCNAL